jgi:hypothetical protein
MSRLLTIILKKSVLPASLLIVGKLIGLWLAISLYSLNYGIANDLGERFSVQIFFYDKQETLIANTFSDAFMFFLLLVGLLIILIRAKVFSADKEDATVVNDVETDLGKLFKVKESIVVNLIVWGVYLLIAYFLLLRNSFYHFNQAWLSAVTGTLLIILVASMFKMVEFYVDKVYPGDKYDLNS